MEDIKSDVAIAICDNTNYNNDTNRTRDLAEQL